MKYAVVMMLVIALVFLTSTQAYAASSAREVGSDKWCAAQHNRSTALGGGALFAALAFSASLNAAIYVFETDNSPEARPLVGALLLSSAGATAGTIIGSLHYRDRHQGHCYVTTSRLGPEADPSDASPVPANNPTLRLRFAPFRFSGTF